MWLMLSSFLFIRIIYFVIVVEREHKNNDESDRFYIIFDVPLPILQVIPKPLVRFNPFSLLLDILKRLLPIPPLQHHHESNDQSS